MLSTEARRILLDTARAAVRAAAEGGSVPRPEAPSSLPVLGEDRGAFVTIFLDGRLRGCIGLVEPVLPLLETVARMASSAAVEDPRFPPLTPAEAEHARIEISVLSPMTRVASAEAVEPGRHGVMVRRGRAAGVFLPQVAEETGWDKTRFLTELCAGKAGLSGDAWRDPATELYVFTVEKLAEE